jgi:hypothetical protein
MLDADLCVGSGRYTATTRCVATTLNYTRYEIIVEALGGHGEYVETES